MRSIRRQIEIVCDSHINREHMMYPSTKFINEIIDIIKDQENIHIIQRWWKENSKDATTKNRKLKLKKLNNL